MKIGENIINNMKFLKLLSKTKSERKKKRLLRLATDQELFSIIECAFNILKGKFKLTSRQKHRLIPHLDIVRNIGRVRTNRGIKRIIQKGNGSFLPAILVPILIEAAKQIL